MAEKQNAFDESNMPWVKAESEIVSVPPVIAPTIRTAWLSFWTYVRLPFGALQWLLISWSFFSSLAPPSGIAAGTTALIVSLGIAVTAVGLHKRKFWAWKANMLIIFVDPVSLLLGGFPPRITSADLAGHLMGQVFFGWGLWSCPNYIYFSNRKKLFK
jgi:hypothetical protein